MVKGSETGMSRTLERKTVAVTRTWKIVLRQRKTKTEIDRQKLVQREAQHRRTCRINSNLMPHHELSKNLGNGKAVPQTHLPRQLMIMITPTSALRVICS